MATIRLIPSTYSSSSSSYATVSSGASNMYNNTDHTSNYATLRGRNRNSSTAYYIFIRGFNFDDVPDNAVVSDFTVKIRCYRSSNQRTGANYYLRLASQASNSYVISNTTTSTNIGTSASVITIPTGDLTWEQLSGYGSNFSIEVPLSSTSSSYPYIYVYGAEIEVTYTIPTPRTITSSINGTGTINPTGSVTLYDGDSYMLTINASSPTVTDNGVNVTSQLERITGGTETFIPYDSEYSGFTISNITNAYSGINDSNSANCSLAARTTGELYLDLGPVDIPAGATISSVSCQASLQISRNGSSSSMTASCQMYSGNTAKGSSTTLASSATDVSRTTYTMTMGTWTAAELQNARFYITMYNGASGTVRYIYVYGVTLTVTYSVSGEVYTYTISNIQGNHTIIVTVSATETDKLYIKVNGAWKEVQEAYIKVNGSWVLQSNLTSIFNTTDNFKQG